MKSEFLIFVIYIQFSFLTLLVLGKWPDDLNTEFPFPTPVPQELNTSKATALTGQSPLLFVFPEHPKVDEFKVINNGETIIFDLVQPTTKSIVTGSIFKDVIYELRQVSLLFSNNYKVGCGTLIDGKRPTMEMANLYVKREYGTIEKAKTKRDGICIVVKQIIVNGVIPNKDFPPFAKVLKKVKEPGSSTIANATEIFPWYNELKNNNKYLVYPGSYTDPFTDYSIQYPCANIVMFAPTGYPSISFPDFRSFQELKSTDGLPMSNSLPNFQTPSVPLVEGEGVEVSYIYE